MAEQRNAALERIAYKRVEPIGTHKAYGHMNRGDQPHVWDEFDVNDYPDSWEGRRLQALRYELKLTLGDAGRILGLGPAQMSSLEHGSATCDWTVAMKLLRETAERFLNNGRRDGR